MIGCFNITLYAYFDIHRIFDLILYRIWDFILWWFDLDFILFDFNFDFVLCLSFLFIFLIHFFIKLVFSFFYNFISINSVVGVFSHIYLYSTYIYYISFLFIFGIVYILLILESCLYICYSFFSDIVTFSEMTSTYKAPTKYQNHIPVFTILFYFSLTIIEKLNFLFFRFFFCQSYILHKNQDFHLTNNRLNLKLHSFLNLYLVPVSYIKPGYLYSIYNYYTLLLLNLYMGVSIIGVFYFYSLLTFSTTYVIFNIIAFKSVKYLYNLDICYILLFHRNIFNTITFLFLIAYIVFTINIFSVFVRDFVQINIIFNFINIFLVYFFWYFNFSTNSYFWIKKQLIYLNYN